MALTKEKENFSNKTCYYKLTGINTIENAIDWLDSVRFLSGIEVTYISMVDLLNRSDEGSDSTQLDARIPAEEWKSICKNRNVDLILLTGTYFENPVVIGVDLRTLDAYITTRKKTTQMFAL